MNNWFEESPSAVSTIEKAILLEDVEFSGMLPHLKVTGKFNVPILTPTMKAGVEVESKNRTPKIKTQSNVTLETSSYTTTNYLILEIPKYMLVDFIQTIEFENNVPLISGKIPARDEFIVGFLGEDINNVRIIGINKE